MGMTIVWNDLGDWMGVYVDGRLRHEGHSISERELLKLAGVEHDYIYDYEIPEYEGRLPAALADLNETGVRSNG